MPPYTLSDERRVCSGFSPGIVGDDEELLRILFNPEHIGEEQEVLPTAVSLEDLSDNGLSVYRKRYFDIDIVRANIDKQMSRKPEARLGCGISILTCSIIRGFEDDGQRCFIVIDDASEKNVAHASIYSAFSKNSRSQLMKLRSKLLLLMKERCSIEDIQRPE
jgi:hypothetical protein